MNTARNMTSQDLHVVLGASGAAGSALVRELVRQGRAVRAVSRRPRPGTPGVQWASADVNDPRAVAEVARGARVVYHAAQPEYTRWAQEFPAMTRAVLEGVEASGARLVFADNLYMYGPVRGPLTEDSPQEPTSKKGRVRLAVAGMLLEAHRAGRVEVAIGRASDHYGPGVDGSVVGRAFFGAVLAGRRAPLFGRADQPHSFSYVDDVARALVLLGDRDEAGGQVWHLPAGEPLTGGEFARLVAREAGVPPRAPLVLPAPAVRALGLVVPLMRELADVLYQAQAPFVSDGGRFTRAFGFVPTPHAEAVRRTVEALRVAEQQPAHAAH